MGKPVVHLSDDDIAVLRESSLLVGRTLAEVARHIAPGVTTEALDRMAETATVITTRGKSFRMRRRANAGRAA